MPFEIQHNIPSPPDSVAVTDVMPVLAEWVAAGADLIEALGSPPQIVKAFEKLQKAMLGYV